MNDREQKYFNSLYLRCEFDDECENCDSPEKGSYAVGYTNDECGEEVDYYICGKCAEDTITQKLAEYDKEIESINDYLKTFKETY